MSTGKADGWGRMTVSSAEARECRNTAGSIGKGSIRASNAMV
ncbi:MAG: hypothetical protein ACI3XQ_13150 [Eubacteriales bacterium]